MSETLNQNRYSIVELGDYRFAVPVNMVKEIIHLPTVSEVPNVSAHFRGVFNLRGQIYPLLDLKYIFSLEGKSVKANQYAVLIEHDQMRYAAAIDSALDVLEFDPSELEALPKDTPQVFAPYVQSVVAHYTFGDIFILNMEKVIQTEALNAYRI
ncbi:MAG: hypothetical protein GF313_11495 [Caldithrix sp.]|nr:hypothetical protein [Caldithrix sp.]